MSMLSGPLLRGVSSQLQMMSITTFSNRFASSLSTLPEPPKRPMNAFLEFAMSQPGNDKFPNLGLAMKSHAVTWKQMRATDKEVFLTKGKKNLEEYNKKKADFMNLLKKNNQLEEYKKQKAVAKVKKAQLNLKKSQSMLNKPKMPIANPYGLFLQEQMAPLQKEMKGKPITEIFKEASSRWSKLSVADKKKYKDRYGTVRVQYEKDLDTWRKNLRKNAKLQALEKVEEKLARRKTNLKRVINPEAFKPKKKKRKVAKKVSKKKVVSKKKRSAKKTAASKKGAKKKVAKKAAKSKKGAATKKKAVKARK